MADGGFVYGGQTILSHPVFVETILPFLLVFTIVFAVLQKTKILGDGKRQIDAIVALVIGLLVISFGQATGIILQMIPVLAVSLVVILVLMLMLGSFTKPGEFFDNFPKGVKWGLVVAVVLTVVITLLKITGGWTYISDLIFIGDGSSIFVNIFFVLIIIGAIVAVIIGSKGDSGSGGKSSG